MAAFFSKVQLFYVVYHSFGKPCSQLHQFPYSVWTISYHHFNNIWVTQAGTCFQSVLYMGFKTVFCTQNRCYTPLGIKGGRLPFSPFCNKRNRSKLRCFESKTNTRNSTSYDKKVGFYFHVQKRKILPLKCQPLTR